ncbi:MAG: 2-phosphosulfolactate phosphatase, partial [Lachnospiraceae bacterium]
MVVKIEHLLEGARRAEGVTVIIDVFRAFTLECYMYSFGARQIRPVGGVDEVFALREHFPGCVLVGERKGLKLEGFDYGNSPSTMPPEAVRGKVVLHTTSAGTQGIIAAKNAAETLTGSLVNASAVAKYIIRKNPDKVTLVAMGTGGLAPAEEDELCAEYLKGLLEGKPMPDIRERAEALCHTAGAK